MISKLEKAVAQCSGVLHVVVDITHYTLLLCLLNLQTKAITS